jgi:hypothetical protein
MDFTICLLIPVFNRIQLTNTCLNNIFDSTGTIGLNIVVIDDGSVDGTSDVIRNCFPAVHLLSGDGNLWWSGGINMGAEYAINELNATHLILWNNDVTPAEDYFHNVLARIEQSPNRILGSYIFDQNSGNIWSKGGAFNLKTGARSMIPEKLGKSEHVKSWLPGMGTIVPVNVVKNIGYWNSIQFPQYHGDFDFTIRASLAGYEIEVCEDLVIYNDTRFSSVKGIDLNSYIKSLKSSTIGSRYNISKDILMYKKYSTTPLWIFSFLKKYISYTIKTFIKI